MTDKRLSVLFYEQKQSIRRFGSTTDNMNFFVYQNRNMNWADKIEVYSHSSGMIDLSVPIKRRNFLRLCPFCVEPKIEIQTVEGMYVCVCI